MDTFSVLNFASEVTRFDLDGSLEMLKSMDVDPCYLGQVVDCFLFQTTSTPKTGQTRYAANGYVNPLTIRAFLSKVLAPASSAQELRFTSSPDPFSMASKALSDRNPQLPGFAKITCFILAKNVI